MRIFLNQILSEIGSESLTDLEFDSLPDGLTESYTLATYEALKAVLQSRESISGQLKKLKAFYLVQGVDVTAPANAAASNILIGGAL